MEKRQRIEAQKELKEYQQKLHQANRLNAEVYKLHSEIAAIANQVSEQLMPAT